MVTDDRSTGNPLRAAGGQAGERWVGLPGPRSSVMSLEEAMETRRSVRRFGSAPLSLEQVGQLLWSCQGVTSEDGGRTAPSAGALYPLGLWLVASRVTALSQGIYGYHPDSGRLSVHQAGDFSRALAAAALDQEWVAAAPAVLAITAVISRTAVKYGSRAERYVLMEVGHAAQNVYLQAQSLGLGTVIVGAFDDADVAEVLSLPDDHAPMALLPVGSP